MLFQRFQQICLNLSVDIVHNIERHVSVVENPSSLPTSGYTGALKAPVRWFGNHLSGQMEISIPIVCSVTPPQRSISPGGGPLFNVSYCYSLNAGSKPYTSLMEH